MHTIYTKKLVSMRVSGVLQGRLVKAQAVALHRSRIMVHPGRFAEVAERAAIDEFACRVSHG